ncbi:hypothetical protein J6590_019204 [Homalodisca vitripennis]|nr:hypothetical protein J6590_019204 [Homalodisca vitripennis]
MFISASPASLCYTVISYRSLTSNLHTASDLGTYCCRKNLLALHTLWERARVISVDCGAIAAEAYSDPLSTAGTIAVFCRLCAVNTAVFYMQIIYNCGNEHVCHLWTGGVSLQKLVSLKPCQLRERELVSTVDWCDIDASVDMQTVPQLRDEHWSQATCKTCQLRDRARVSTVNWCDIDASVDLQTVPQLQDEHWSRLSYMQNVPTAGPSAGLGLTSRNAELAVRPGPTTSYYGRSKFYRWSLHQNGAACGQFLAEGPVSHPRAQGSDYARVITSANITEETIHRRFPDLSSRVVYSVLCCNYVRGCKIGTNADEDFMLW